MTTSPPAANNMDAEIATEIEAEFEFEAALKRLGGDQELFARLAARFGDDITPIIADLARYLKQGDKSKAGLAIHTLKGLAGTMGAVRMAKHAAKIEARLAVAEMEIDTDSTVNIFSVLSKRAQAALRTNVDNIMPAIASAPSTTARMDAATLHSKIDELDALLQGFNMRAISVFSELEKALASDKNEELMALSHAINKLDFKLSLQCSQALRASLKKIS